MTYQPGFKHEYADVNGNGGGDDNNKDNDNDRSLMMMMMMIINRLLSDCYPNQGK